MAWRDEAAALVDDPARRAAAAAAPLGKLLPARVRQEGFCDGHPGGMVRAGHFEAICARLAALLEEDPACREPAALAWRDALGPCGRIGSLTPQRQLVLGWRGGGDGTGTPEPAATASPAVRLRCLACGVDHGVPARRVEDARCPTCQGARPGR